MSFIAPGPQDVALPQMPDQPPHAASLMFNCSLDLLATPLHLYSADSALAGLGYQINHTTLPWPGRTDDAAPHNLPDDLIPFSVNPQLQTARSGGDTIVNPHCLVNIKAEDGYLSDGNSRYYSRPDLRSSSSVDSLVQTIQLKSKRRLPSLSSCSSSDSMMSRSSSEAKTPEPEQHQYNHHCRRARKIHRCNVASCTKTFHQKTHLEIHIRAHSGYKPFVR